MDYLNSTQVQHFFFILDIALPILAGAVLGFIKLQKNPLDRRWTLYLLSCGGLIISAVTQARVLGMFTLRDRYDLYVYTFDKLLGNPSFVVGKMLLRESWLHIAAIIDYRLIYLSMVLTLTWYFATQPDEEAIGVSKAMFLAQLGVLVYLVIPVSGPVYAFANFPETPSAVTAHTIQLDATPNGVPSLHFTTALLVLYFARRWRTGLILGSVNLVLTILSTLGAGEHYAFDLFAAIPFTVFLLYVSDDLFAYTYLPALFSGRRWAKVVASEGEKIYAQLDAE